ncbi:MAG: hypothetical protein SOZ05_09290 [Muribaculaceae bacterium]|nr:hypothetical protein [Muribaculaceae bacterium]
MAIKIRRQRHQNGVARPHGRYAARQAAPSATQFTTIVHKITTNPTRRMAKTTTTPPTLHPQGWRF